MKRFLLLTLLAVIFISDKTADAKTLKLNKKSATITVGQNTTIKANQKVITWKSNNKAIATVTKKGVVRGKKQGKTTIIAQTKKKSAKCKITVKEKKVVQPTNTNPMPTVKPKTPTATKPTPPPFKGDIYWVATDPTYDCNLFDGTLTATYKNKTNHVIRYEVEPIMEFDLSKMEWNYVYINGDQTKLYQQMGYIDVGESVTIHFDLYDSYPQGSFDFENKYYKQPIYFYDETGKHIADECYYNFSVYL